MRSLILTVAFLSAGCSAMASSIEPIDSKAPTGADSIIVESCAACPPLKPAEVKKDYVVPELRAGTQSIVVRDIDGQKKVVRTEAWMGGSPVVFVSKPTPEALEAAGAPTDGIDRATTAAVPPSTKAAPVPPPLDIGGFVLRPSR